MSSHNPERLPSPIESLDTTPSEEVVHVYEMFGDKVLVKPLPDAEVTSGGIIVPEGNRPRPTRAVVVDPGMGKSVVSGGKVVNLEPAFLAGQTVLYGRYAGTDVEHNGEAHVILREDEIMAIELEG